MKAQMKTNKRRFSVGSRVCGGREATVALTRDEVSKVGYDAMFRGDQEIACLARVALKFGPDGDSWNILNHYRAMGRI